MTIVALTLGYIAMIFFVAWVIEPYLRIRHNIHITNDTLIKNDLKLMVSIGWPVGLPIWFFLKGANWIWNHIICMEEKVNQLWAVKVPSEKIVDETKSDYRNFSLIERK